jgi:hypothetical protein
LLLIAKPRRWSAVSQDERKAARLGLDDTTLRPPACAVFWKAVRLLHKGDLACARGPRVCRLMVYYSVLCSQKRCNQFKNNSSNLPPQGHCSLPKNPPCEPSFIGTCGRYGSNFSPSATATVSNYSPGQFCGRWGERRSMSEEREKNKTHMTARKPKLN